MVAALLILVGIPTLYLVPIGAYSVAHEIARTSEREAKVWAAIAGVVYVAWLLAVLT